MYELLDLMFLVANKIGDPGAGLEHSDINHWSVNQDMYSRLCRSDQLIGCFWMKVRFQFNCWFHS